MVVNAEQRTATVLYRNGVEVARTDQQLPTFPLQYRGGHAPYSPRTNRVCMQKRGRLVVGLLNGQEIIRYHDAAPLAVSRIGFGGTDTHVNFSAIDVRDLTALQTDQQK
jgi:hypothetical protein